MLSKITIKMIVLKLLMMTTMKRDNNEAFGDDGDYRYNYENSLQTPR